jgi:hypothetical protein
VNTAIAITAIIAAVALLNSGIAALRDVAKAKHQSTLARVRTAASTRLADDECGEQERRGYHSAMSEILAILNEQEQQ